MCGQEEGQSVCNYEEFESKARINKSPVTYPSGCGILFVPSEKLCISSGLRKSSAEIVLPDAASPVNCTVRTFIESYFLSSGNTFDSFSDLSSSVIWASHSPNMRHNFSRSSMNSHTSLRFSTIATFAPALPTRCSAHPRDWRYSLVQCRRQDRMLMNLPFPKSFQTSPRRRLC